MKAFYIPATTEENVETTTESFTTLLPPLNHVETTKDSTKLLTTVEDVMTTTYQPTIPATTQENVDTATQLVTTLSHVETTELQLITTLGALNSTQGAFTTLLTTLHDVEISDSEQLTTTPRDLQTQPQTLLTTWHDPDTSAGSKTLYTSLEDIQTTDEASTTAPEALTTMMTRAPDPITVKYPYAAPLVPAYNGSDESDYKSGEE